MATLYMLPVPISDSGSHTIPGYASELMRTIPVFVMERGKTGRQFLKACAPNIALQDKVFIEMGEAPYALARQEVQAHLRAGRDVAVVSESGCPGVADPGQLFAEGAHLDEIRVVPVVGPSSILLALMASGFNGQQFAFTGYVTNKKEDVSAALRKLEDHSRQHFQTQIFIETPYRNQALLDALIRYLQPATRLCVASDVTGPNEWIKSLTIAEWRKSSIPQLGKRPTIYLILA